MPHCTAAVYSSAKTSSGETNGVAACGVPAGLPERGRAPPPGYTGNDAEVEAYFNSLVYDASPGKITSHLKPIDTIVPFPDWFGDLVDTWKEIPQKQVSKTSYAVVSDQRRPCLRGSPARSRH